MHLGQVSLVSRSWSLVGARDLQLGLLLQCIRQSNGSIFWDRSLKYCIFFNFESLYFASKWSDGNQNVDTIVEFYL